MLCAEHVPICQCQTWSNCHIWHQCNRAKSDYMIYICTYKHCTWRSATAVKTLVQECCEKSVLVFFLIISFIYIYIYIDKKNCIWELSTLRSLVCDISQLLMNSWGSLAKLRKNSLLVFNWLIVSTVSCIWIKNTNH